MLRHAEDDPDRSVRDACAWTLGSLGPPAVTAAVVPLYIAAIDRAGAPPLLRGELIDSLARFGPDARGAVPAIVRVLRSAEADRRRDAKPPGLVRQADTAAGIEERRAFRDAVDRIAERRSAATALGVLAPGTPSAGDAVSALATALIDPDSTVNQEAVKALLAFGPAAKAACPALLRAIGLAAEGKDLWAPAG